jgi:hypothetical protein
MRGRIAIVVILVAAVASAGFAWWWNYQRAVRARELWGKSAMLIRSPERVVGIQLVTPIADPGGSWPEMEEIDISDRPGLLNARTSLLVDESFNWTPGVDSLTTETRYSTGICFERDNASLTLLFADDAPLVWVKEKGQIVELDEKTAAGWRDYLRRAFSSPVRR